MKKAFSLILCLILLAGIALPAAAASSKKTFTMMIYLCGTDLESRSGAATADLKEMVSAGIPKNGNVTVYIQTGGCKNWHVNGITPKKVERWILTSSGLARVESVGTADMGHASTFSDFLTYGFENFPADRYGLIMWDHGSGASGALCYDEMSYDGLFYPEIAQGLKTASKAENYKKFAFIGFDACLMGTFETAAHIAPYADYMIASEEVEPGSGWCYDKWLPTLIGNPGVDIPTLGRKIVDTFIAGASASFYSGDYATLSVCDLSEIKPLSAAVNDMGQSLSDVISEGNYTSVSRQRAGLRSFGELSSSTATDMVDMREFANAFAQFDRGAADSLLDALDDFVIYSKHTRNLSNVSGLSILVPYKTKATFGKYMPEYDRLKLYPGYAAFVNGMKDKLTSGGSGSSGLFNNLGVGTTTLEDLFPATHTNDGGSGWDSFGSLFGSSGSTSSGSSDWWGTGSTGASSTDWFGTGSSGSSSTDWFGTDSSGSSSTDWFGTGSSGSSSTDWFGTGSSGSSSSDWWGMESQSDGLSLGSLLGALFGGGTDYGSSGDWGGDLFGSYGFSGYDSYGSGSYGSSGSALDSLLEAILSDGLEEPDFGGLFRAGEGLPEADGKNVTVNNPFAAASKDAKVYTCQLTPEQMAKVARVEANLMIDLSDPDFECYFELGYLQNVAVDWDNCRIYGSFDKRWASLDGQMVPIWDQIANENYVRSLIPAYVNGEKQYIIVIFDEDTPGGRVTGYTKGITEEGSYWRGTSLLEEGDVVVPEYQLIYWDGETGKQLTLAQPGDVEIIAGPGGEIPFEYAPIEDGLLYRYGFCLTDIYGNSIFTGTVPVNP